MPSRIRGNHYHSHYGFTDETINQLQLGWANGSLWTHFIADLKINRDLALKTGLFVIIKGGKVEDFFTDRLVFPYWKQGRVVYFIARRTEYTGDEEWEKSKYKKLLTHSERRTYVSETVRNNTFYNEDAARGADTILVTEGVTDCISAIQANVPCISPVTTRFRKDDLSKVLSLTRLSNKVVICNDAEESGAGDKGALDTASVLHAEGRDVRIAKLPRPSGVDKIDVNEFLKSHTSEDFNQVLNQADRYIEHLIRQIPANTNKLDLSRLLSPILTEVTKAASIEQEAYYALIAKQFGIAKKIILSTVKEIQQKAKLPVAGDKQKPVADAVKGEIFEESDHYYTRISEGMTLEISSFHMEPTLRINMPNGEIIVADIHTKRGLTFNDIHFPKRVWNSKSKFINALPNTHMQWTGTDDNVQGLLRLISNREIPTKLGTDVMGYIETDSEPCWLVPDTVISRDGRIEQSDVVYIPNGSSFTHRIKMSQPVDDSVEQTLQIIIPSLLALNEPKVILPVLGWFFATPFKPQLMKKLGHFPFLMVWGTQGGGKSSIIKEIFWPLFGIALDRNEPFSVTETEFALMKLFSSTNAIPIFLDEYRPSDMATTRLNTLHRYLRRLYSGEVEERGRKDMTVQSFPLIAPVCLAGESRPDDPALADRMISVSPGRNALREHPEFVKTFLRLKRYDLGLLTEPYIRFCLNTDITESLQEAKEVTDDVLKNITNGELASLRCRDNLQVMILGLLQFEHFAKQMGIDIPDIDVAIACSTVIDDLMDGDQGAKNQLDNFMESCSVLAYNGQLSEGKHYAYINGDFCLHLQSCWQLHQETQRRMGQAVESNGLRSLKRLVKENFQRGGYVKEVDRRVHLNGSSPRTLVIDLAQAKKYLDIEDFPMREDRMLGGWRRAEYYNED